MERNQTVKSWSRNS